MEARALTIADLLPSGFTVDPAQLSLDGSASSPAAGLRDFIRAKALDGIGSALKLDVIDLIARAWSQVAELQKAAQQQKAGGTPDTLFLAKHEVVCEDKLKLTLEVLGTPALTDHLGLKLTAAIEGVGLIVDTGCIVGIEAGRGSAKVALHYSNTRLAGQSTDWVALPARLMLSRPVRIAPATAQGAGV